MASKLTHSGNLILIGFGMALVAMSVLVYMTLKQDFQLVTDNYYEKELVYQSQIDAEKNALAYSDSFFIKKSGDEIHLQLPASLTNTMDSGKVFFYCGSDKKNDRTVPLTNNNTGLYIIDSKGWKATAYTPQISFLHQGKKYYKELHLDL